MCMLAFFVLPGEIPWGKKKRESYRSNKQKEEGGGRGPERVRAGVRREPDRTELQLPL